MFTLYYLILGERKALGQYPTWAAAWNEAARRKHNYCGSCLYIAEPTRNTLEQAGGSPAPQGKA